jgi:Bacterial extracellular solute-binding protein
MDTLEKAGLLASDTREDLLGNTLVIVVPLDSKLQITAATDLTKAEVKKIAVAEPSSVWHHPPRVSCDERALYRHKEHTLCSEPRPIDSDSSYLMR